MVIKPTSLKRGETECSETQKQGWGVFENQECLHWLLERMNIIPWEFDISTLRFTYVGPQAVNILGYPVEEWYGNAFWYRHIHPEDRDDALRLCKEIAKFGKDGEFEYRMLAADGRIIWLRDIVSITPDKNPYKVCGVMFDITDYKQVDEVRKRKRQEVEERNAYLERRIQKEVENNRQKDFIMIHQSRLAAMGEMIGNIAHQWRQPLNALSIFMDNIKFICKNSGMENKELDEFIEKCFHLITKMSSTIDDFRNFFKPDRKKRKFNINQTVENSLSLIDASLNYHSISVVVKEKEKLTAVGYPNEYSQVILNVLENAKDAIVLKGIDGKIEIDVEGESDSGVVKIKDNGVGIPEDLLGNIFDPYYTTKEGREGTGIGLYISKMIIEERMNGRIEVQNDSQGTEFKIIVPTLPAE